MVRKTIVTLGKYFNFKYFLGNAAGLLARRGMMMGSQRSGNAPVYSDDDSDSDTEEYISNVHK